MVVQRSDLETNRGQHSIDLCVIEAHHRMPDGKLIAVVCVCLKCGRTFRPERGRKRCPFCNDLLRARTMIMSIQ